MSGLFSRENVFMFLASLVVAVLLWLQIQSQSDPAMPATITVKLQLRNLSDSMVATRSPSGVDVIVTATAKELQDMDKEAVVAYVDLSNASPGLRRYPVEVSAPARLAPNVRLRRPTVEVELSPLTRRVLAVQVETRGSITRDLQYDGATSEPATVEVTGPTSAFAAIKTVRAMLDLSRVRPGEAYTVPLEILAADNKPIPFTKADPSQVTIRPGLAATPPTRRLLIEPTFKGTLPVGYRLAGLEIHPTQVEVEGPLSVLGKLLKLETIPIDLTQLTADTTVRVDLVVPAGVRVRGETSARISLKVQKREIPEEPSP